MMGRSNALVPHKDKRLAIQQAIYRSTWCNSTNELRICCTVKVLQEFSLSFTQRNWVFATNSDFLFTISLEPNVADLRYFKLWILLDQVIWVWNIKGLQHRVLKILRFKYLILFQRLNSFLIECAITQFIHKVTLTNTIFFC